MFQKMGPAPSPRFCHTMTAAQNKIYVFGGESANSPKPDEEGIMHILDTSKIKYPSLSATSANSQQMQQGSPKENFSRSPVKMGSQSSIDSDTARHIIPATRQSSIPKEEEQNYSKSSMEEIRAMQQLQQAQNASRSIGSLKKLPENVKEEEEEECQHKDIKEVLVIHHIVKQQEVQEDFLRMTLMQL